MSHFRKAALAAAVLFAPLSTTPVLAAPTTHGGVTFPDGDISFADSVYSYTPGFGFSGGGSYCQSASEAIGTPDFNGNTCGGYVSLGGGGELVLQFTDNALTASGDTTADLHVFEIGEQVEEMTISISTDAVTWIVLGLLDGQPTSIDIDATAGVSLGTDYSYVRIVDNPDANSHSGPYAGADIDAVGAISSAPPPVVPLPAGGLLLLSALGGAGAWRHLRRG